MFDWIADIARSIAAYRLVADFAGVLLLGVAGFGLAGLTWKHRAAGPFTLWRLTGLLAAVGLLGVGTLGALVLLRVVAPG